MLTRNFKSSHFEKILWNGGIFQSTIYNSSQRRGENKSKAWTAEYSYFNSLHIISYFDIHFIIVTPFPWFLSIFHAICMFSSRTQMSLTFHVADSFHALFMSVCLIQIFILTSSVISQCDSCNKFITHGKIN